MTALLDGTSRPMRVTAAVLPNILGPSSAFRRSAPHHMGANIAGAATHPTVLACEFDHRRDAFLPRRVIRTVRCLPQPGLRHPHRVGIDKLSRRVGSLLNPGKVVAHPVDLHA